MGWAMIYDETKGYYDVQINPANKTFTTTEDVGDYSGIIEMLKYTLLTNDDDINNEENDPNFTLSAPVFAYYDKNDPRGSRLEYLLNNVKGANYIDDIKKECERSTKVLLDKEFKNKKVCKYIGFTPRQEGNQVVLDIVIFFTDNTAIDTSIIYNSLSNERK